MIPDSIKIGCYDYKIVETDEPIIVESKECSGKIDYRNHIIKIKRSGISQQAKEETLWHEIIHGIFDYRSINPAKNDEETIVEELALGLYGIMKQNGLMPGQKVGD